MVTFDTVVCMFLSVMKCVGNEFFDRGLKSRSEISDDLLGHAVGVES